MPTREQNAWKKAENLINERLAIQEKHRQILLEKEKKPEKKIGLLNRILNLLNLFSKGISMSEIEAKQRDAARKRRAGLVNQPTQTTGEVKMSDDKEINQHKRMAMGKSVTGMKKGGKVEGSKKEEAKESKKFEKMEDEPKKMKKGGCMKKGGKVKK